MTRTNRQWLLARRPHGMVSEADFQYRESVAPTPDLDAGEILVRTLMLGFDPAMRGWMDDVPSYLPPVGIGEVMRASAVGEVVESRNADYPVGTRVSGFLGWQDYAVLNSPGMRPATRLPEGTPPAMALGMMGGSGLTAYVGLYSIGGIRPGETVLVSGAAGSVGSVAAQIARILECRVIGIAGGPEKCRWLSDECGIDAVIDYKSEDVSARLAALCPDGVNLFFDNVGGALLEAGIEHMADHGRIVLCGGISTYNDAEPQPGPRNLMKLVTRRIRMEGFIVMDHGAEFGEAMKALAGWAASGEIRSRDDIQTGFANIPRTFLRLFDGSNRGKQMLELDRTD